MDDFKISLFESEYKKPFPVYRILDDASCRQLVNQLSSKYNLNVLNIDEELMLKQSLYADSNATEDFRLIRVLNSIGINPLSEVFINWYRFKRIDRFDLKDLDKYFDDIWFPVSDDIDLFDASLDWILSIRHDGCITFCKYNVQ
ncbi:hypothetical protein [Pedobacter metabolipauper]|uniref:Uncharacterized protein n=1 Tax=Pedobacter metabolipauper TaxID=425513 RepID=A0A4R6T1S2_9SPHI|nr:hypothetical protein [Pedobacter metabolipauper]TDQ12029.1 hypothetical protein ATK78_1160 [Pedobacter metabolipauper]